MLLKKKKPVTAGIEYLIRSVMTHNFAGGKIMGKLLGCHIMSKQESCHLINSLPLVRCYHNFIMINLEPSANIVSIINESEDSLENTNECSITRVYSILEMYGKRVQPNVYDRSAKIVCSKINLEELNFNDFCKKFYVG